MFAALLSSAGGLVGSLVGPNKKDAAERFPTNQAKYEEAAAGGPGAAAALLYLKGRTGRYGVINGIGGWATQAAKDDANAKYEAAVSGLHLPPNYPDQPNELQMVISRTWDNIRRETAIGVRDAGSLATTGASQSVGGERNALSTGIVSAIDGRMVIVAAIALVLVLVMRGRA
jgi:hypothetical protein